MNSKGGKGMRKLFIALVCTLVVFGLTACGGESKKATITGKWEGTGSGEGAEMTIDETTIKFEDGSGGNYKYDADTNTMTLTEGGQSVGIKGVLDGGRLTINLSGQDITFKRK